jgi:hypothetical protein
LFANLILKHSNTISVSDLESDLANKLFTMSLKNQVTNVKLIAIENLQNQTPVISDLKDLIFALKESEKNEEVLKALNSL